MARTVQDAQQARERFIRKHVDPVEGAIDRFIDGAMYVDGALIIRASVFLSHMPNDSDSKRKVMDELKSRYVDWDFSYGQNWEITLRPKKHES